MPNVFSANPAQQEIMGRGVRIGSKVEVLKTLRSLLRITRDQSNSKNVRECLWSQQILSQYRTRQFETNRDQMRKYRSEATDLLMMLNNIKEQKVCIHDLPIDWCTIPHIVYTSICGIWMKVWNVD